MAITIYTCTDQLYTVEHTLKTLFLISSADTPFSFLHEYTDCGVPIQPGVIIEPPESTLKDSAANVISCDTDAGYVGTPASSSIYCEASGNWTMATGCTGKSGL